MPPVSTKYSNCLAFIWVSKTSNEKVLEMRTPKSVARKLITHAATVIGCKKHEVFTRLKHVEHAFMDTLRNHGFSAVQITPYRNGTWMITAMDSPLDYDGEPMQGVSRWHCLPFDFAEFWSDPEPLIREFCNLLAD